MNLQIRYIFLMRYSTYICMWYTPARHPFKMSFLPAHSSYQWIESLLLVHMLHLLTLHVTFWIWTSRACFCDRPKLQEIGLRMILIFVCFRKIQVKACFIPSYRRVAIYFRCFPNRKHIFPTLKKYGNMVKSYLQIRFNNKYNFGE